MTTQNTRKHFELDQIAMALGDRLKCPATGSSADVSLNFRLMLVDGGLLAENAPALGQPRDAKAITERAPPI